MIKKFIKRADAGWDGGLGTGSGIMSNDYVGLGFGVPGGGGSGLGNQTNLPPSHQGHAGDLAAGPWSGDSNVKERYKNEFVKKEVPIDYTPEELIKEIRTLLKINTPESKAKVTYLKQILDDKIRRMKASRRAYDASIHVKNATLVRNLKEDAFVQALFTEHDVPLIKLEEVKEFPEELTHFALHNLVHVLSKTAGELRPLTFTSEEQGIINRVREAADALDIDVYLVGGFVRDRIAGGKEKEAAGDLDFMCERDADKIVSYLAKKYGAPEPVKYSRSKAVMLTLDDHPIDFIDAKHIYRPLRQGFDTLEDEEDETVAFDDAYRRDLTVNSLMYDVRRGKLLDPTGKGLKDLRGGTLNTIIDPFIKFRIHAPDMLRALRFAATLGYKLGPKMLEAMKANAERLRPRDKGGDISNRRIRKELRKAIDTPEHWAKMRELLQQAGLDVILAKDIEDVQEDFEGGIEYHFDEKEKALEKQKEKREKEQKKERAMNIKKFIKQSGLFDMFKKKELDYFKQKEEALKQKRKQLQPKEKKEPTGPIQPLGKQERLQYIAERLDEQLKSIAPKQHQQFVNDFLAQYKITKGIPEYSVIISLLKNYSPFIPSFKPPLDPWGNK